MTRRTTAAIASLSALLALTACGQKREETHGLDAEQAARFGLTPDAEDPTRRNLDAGYYRWKEVPETEGTYAPNSPEHRMIGGPDDF